jgi:hypothetical protein
LNPVPLFTGQPDSAPVVEPLPGTASVRFNHFYGEVTYAHFFQARSAGILQFGGNGYATWLWPAISGATTGTGSDLNRCCITLAQAGYGD